MADHNSEGPFFKRAGLIFLVLTHASVDVFWSRGNEQEELCSRLYFNADSHYSVQAALKC